MLVEVGVLGEVLGAVDVTGLLGCGFAVCGFVAGAGAGVGSPFLESLPNGEHAAKTGTVNKSVPSRAWLRTARDLPRVSSSTAPAAIPTIPTPIASFGPSISGLPDLAGNKGNRAHATASSLMPVPIPH